MHNNYRQEKIIKTSIISIITNACIAFIKIIIGLSASSIAIISEGINNITDATSAFLTLIGTKLSTKHPDKKHPFGYGRIEYLTNLIVSIMIIYTSISLLKNSVVLIFHPKSMTITFISIILICITAVIKFILGIYMIKVGKETESSALTSIGKEGRNDSLFSLITIFSSLLYIYQHISLDAYAGILFALVIMRTGIETFVETISELIGRSGKKELADQLYKEIRSTKGILCAADMMLHNYGPNNYSGSVNIEIDHNENIGDIYEFIHELQLHIMKEYHVTMVFGIYAVNNDLKEMRTLRQYINQFVKNSDHVISYHALYKSNKTNNIYVDFVVDYELKNWDLLKEQFIDYMYKQYPDNGIELTIETEYV